MPKLGTPTRNHEPPRPGDCEYSLELENSQQRLQRLAGSDPNVHRAAKAAQPRVRMEAWRSGFSKRCWSTAVPLLTPSGLLMEASTRDIASLARTPLGHRPGRRQDFGKRQPGKARKSLSLRFTLRERRMVWGRFIHLSKNSGSAFQVSRGISNSTM